MVKPHFITRFARRGISGESAVVLLILASMNHTTNNRFEGYPIGGAVAQTTGGLPALAQVIDQRTFNVLNPAPPPSVANSNTIFFPPGTTHQSLFEKPFHVYDPAFLDIIGPNPTLTLVNRTGTPMRFHEAPIWNPDTDEMFFCQVTGNRSGVIQKISLAGITPAIASQRNASVNVEFVPTTPQVVNPNGGTNYRNRLLINGMGLGSTVPPAIYLVSPNPPYNSTVILDNFFGRQFNSINDLAINPRTGEIYFTDPSYGYLIGYRPPTALQKQVYRFNQSTGAVSVVADDFNMPNGLAFSPNGQHIYIADSGVLQEQGGRNEGNPSSVYRYDVKEDGTFENRKVFAFITPQIPDGVHVDTKGNVYVAAGDGVQVFNPSGKLLGKIYIGHTTANFQFAGKGRMVIPASTELYYATLAAEGAFPGQLYA